MLERLYRVYTHTYIGANNMYPIYSTPSLKKNTIERENGGPACTYKKWKGVCTAWVWTMWALFVATMRHYRAHCVMGQHRRSDGRERELGNNNKSIYREKRVGYFGMKHHLPCILTWERNLFCAWHRFRREQIHFFGGSIDVRLRVADGNKFCRFIGDEKKRCRISRCATISWQTHKSELYTHLKRNPLKK